VLQSARVVCVPLRWRVLSGIFSRCVVLSVVREGEDMCIDVYRR
jgi:hypothetical protein